MTKEDFLKWLSQFKYVGSIRDLVERHRFTEQELDFMAKHLIVKPRKVNARGRGA